MPYGDGTGPFGMGPRTGRGLGYCAGYNSPGFTKGIPMRRGRGFRRWRGFGFRQFFQPRQIWQPTSKEEEKKIIEDEIKLLENDLEALKKRLEELD